MSILPFMLWYLFFKKKKKLTSMKQLYLLRDKPDCLVHYHRDSGLPSNKLPETSDLFPSRRKVCS